MGNTTTLGNKSKFRELLDSFGLPRLIIACFLLLLLIAAPCVGLDFPTQITNIITRFSWNAVMVLAMVPMVHSGCGLNFGLPLGIVSGLLGATLSIELGYTGFASFLMAILIATPFALLFGGGYGWLLNKIKGGEMMIATYVGFSSVSFMCMMWLLLPYKHPTMVWGFSASGLRTVISLEGYYDKALANILTIDLNSIGINLVIPTGTLLFFVLMAVLMWAFLHTKTGTAMTAVGSNPSFAKAAGVSIDKPAGTSLKTLVIGAEPHTDEQRRKIERMLGVKAYNSFGMTEMNGPGVAFECTEQDGMHFWEDCYLVEIINPETGEPVPEGEIGELVLTTLDREMMPLIRYRTRDLTRILPGKCPCGRTHIRIDRIKGRSDDMFIIKGVNIFPMQV